MIPKIIHYCWFGGNEKPKLFKKCYKSWKKYCPDYEIIEWNESNFDLSVCPLYVRQAYEAKKWAFVTDYVRLKVVCENGGVYLDTDVELKKNIDFLLENKAFFGFERGRFVATGLGFGAEKDTPILNEMMQDYDDISFLKDDGTYDITACPFRNTEVFVKHGLIQNNSRQVLDDGVLVLPTSSLCPIDYFTGEKTITEDTISIHWFSASWHTQEENKKHKKAIQKIKRLERIDFLKHIPNMVTKKIIGDSLYNKIKKKIKGDINA